MPSPVDYPVVAVLGFLSLTYGAWLVARLLLRGDRSDNSPAPALLDILGYGESTAARRIYTIAFLSLVLYIGLTTAAWTVRVLRFEHVIEAMGSGVLCLSFYIGSLGLLASDPGQQLPVRSASETVDFRGHEAYRRWAYAMFGFVGTLLAGIMILLTDGFVTVLLLSPGVS